MTQLLIFIHCSIHIALFFILSKFFPLSISLRSFHRILLPSLLNLNTFSNLSYCKHLTTSYIRLITKLISLAHLSPLNQFTHPNVHRLLHLQGPFDMTQTAPFPTVHTLVKDIYPIMSFK